MASGTQRSRWYWRHYYSKENSYAKRLTRRLWRRQGKKYLDDAPPENGTQGWLTH